jgi:hypothetical protein
MFNEKMELATCKNTDMVFIYIMLAYITPDGAGSSSFLNPFFVDASLASCWIVGLVGLGLDWGRTTICIEYYKTNGAGLFANLLILHERSSCFAKKMLLFPAAVVRENCGRNSNNCRSLCSIYRKSIFLTIAAISTKCL